MTIKELINYLNIYGGGYIFEPNSAQSIETINLALREFYLNTPITKTASFNVRGQRPTVRYTNMTCKSGQTITFPISGRAYSMRVSGKGDYFVTDSERTVALQFDTGNEIKVIRGFFLNSGTIRFFSDLSFTIHDLSIYDEVFGRETTSIPDGSPTTVIDLRESYPDFFALVSPPTDSKGNQIEGCRVTDGRIELDSSFGGEVFITYRRLPTPIHYFYEIDEVNEDDPVDVSEEYLIPLVYLIWHCNWCYSDELRAKAYKDKYDAVMADVRAASFSHDRKYVIEDGWA